MGYPIIRDKKGSPTERFLWGNFCMLYCFLIFSVNLNQVIKKAVVNDRLQIRYRQHNLTYGIQKMKNH